MPNNVQELLDRYQISYANYIPVPTVKRTPKSYQLLDEEPSILLSTEKYWTFSVPFTILFFTIMHLIHRSLGTCSRLRAYLIKFSSFSFLVISLIGEQVQTFSFKCFNQMYDLTTNSGPILSYSGQVLNYCLLFSVFMYACSAFWILPYMSPGHCRLILDGYCIKFRSHIGLTIILLTRVVNGFAHSQLYYNPFIQSATIMAMQLVYFLTVLWMRVCYTRKSLFICHVLQHGFKILLYFLAVF